MERKKSLNVREKKFCIFYVNSGSFKEAALMAGYDNPEKSGAALIVRDSISSEIERLFKLKEKNLRRQALTGYERLSFGSVNDAVKLMFCDNPEGSELEAYDLFNVAEIKRPKDGAMEIKFFDRIKALEKLEAAGEESQNKNSSFYNALISGIENESSDKDPEMSDDNEI